MSAPSVSAPVNASAIKSQVQYVEVVNDLREQRALARFAADPVSVIEDNPTRIILSVNPLREENTISRRLTITCKPIWLPKNAAIGE